MIILGTIHGQPSPEKEVTITIKKGLSGMLTNVQGSTILGLIKNSISPSVFNIYQLTLFNDISGYMHKRALLSLVFDGKEFLVSRPSLG
jgi:hypothetical protein